MRITCFDISIAHQSISTYDSLTLLRSQVHRSFDVEGFEEAGVSGKMSNNTLIQTCLLAALGYNLTRVTFPEAGTIDAHPYNLNLPVVPAAITVPESTAQVANVVKCAASNGYKVQSRSGGHSYGNHGLGGTDGAVVIDLKELKQFSMDESTYTASIGSGMLLDEVTHKLYDNGKRAMAHGVCPQVGVGGHFTIGGLGPTARQWGSSLDHVEEVEVVLANSSIVRASSTQNQDVLFAIKGAAASFGIVTEFKVRTEPAPDIAVQYTYELILGNAIERARILADWQNFISDPDLSRKFASIMIVFEHGMLLTGDFYGTREEFDDLGLADRFPIREPGHIAVLTNWLGMTGHAVEELALGVIGGIPLHFYAKSMAFTRDSLMSQSTFEKLFDYLDNTDKDTLLWLVYFDLQAGATGDVPNDATAYAHRDTLYWLQSYAVRLVGPVSNTTIGFLQGINSLIAQDVPSANTRAYPGYVDPLMPDPQERYWGSNLPRLERIKAAIDPNDVFHHPQSVKPNNQDS